MISHVYRGEVNNLVIRIDDSLSAHNIATYLYINYPGCKIDVENDTIKINYLLKDYTIEKNKYYVIPNFSTDRVGLSIVESTENSLLVNFGLKGIEDSFNYKEPYFMLMKENLKNNLK